MGTEKRKTNVKKGNTKGRETMMNDNSNRVATEEKEGKKRVVNVLAFLKTF